MTLMVSRCPKRAPRLRWPGLAVAKTGHLLVRLQRLGLMGFLLNCQAFSVAALEGDAIAIVSGMAGDLGRDFGPLVCFISKFVPILILKCGWLLPGCETEPLYPCCIQGACVLQARLQCVLDFKERTGPCVTVIYKFFYTEGFFREC